VGQSMRKIVTGNTQQKGFVDTPFLLKTGAIQPTVYAGFRFCDTHLKCFTKWRGPTSRRWGGCPVFLTNLKHGTLSPFESRSSVVLQRGKASRPIHKTACTWPWVQASRNESGQKGLMLFRCFDRGSIPFNGNLLSRCSANDHVLGGPCFHEFSHTRFGTIERPNAGAAMGPVSVNPENVEW